MAPKLCTDCGDEPKKPGHPLWCVECWLERQPIHVRIAHAQARSAAMPAGLRRARVPEAQWPAGRRWCSGCQSFVRLRECQGSRCKPCASAAAHASSVLREFDITGAQYDELFKAQDGRCYLCRRASPSRRLAVDHDHRTGEVRGLLCPDPDWGCNLKVVARFDADPDPVAMAYRLVDYLQFPPARKVLG